MSDIAIKVENISKKYQIGENKTYPTLRDKLMELPNRLFKGPKKSKEFWALKDVSFEVKRGEVVGIIGRNGAGKSTMLKILARITEPTSGKITMYGRVASMLEVGTGFNPELTGRENIYLNGAIIGMKKSEIKAKFQEIIDFADIGNFLDTPVKHYSSGMYVRLAFAISANLDADILLVDEVLAVGDAEFQKKCIGKMSDYSKSGRTVIFVSHNTTAINNICTEALYLSDGKLLFKGKVKQVMEKYLDKGNIEIHHKEWKNKNTAPGNKNVVISSVKILGPYDADILDISMVININIEYYNLRSKNILTPVIHLKDQAGMYVFASANFPSYNLNSDDWYGKELKIGRYQTTCQIPSNLLNDQLYSVDIGFTSRYNRWEINVQNVLQFRPEDNLSQVKEYSGKWVGVIRPKLSWSTLLIKKDATWVI
jgi:lipopolysaccharide transport system ATP-binding protein